jgi:hypothetical protein
VPGITEQVFVARGGENEAQLQDWLSCRAGGPIPLLSPVSSHSLPALHSLITDFKQGSPTEVLYSERLDALTPCPLCGSDYVVELQRTEWKHYVKPDRTLKRMVLNRINQLESSPPPLRTSRRRKSCSVC